MPISPPVLPANGISLSLPIGRPWKSCTPIAPLKLATQTLSSVTARAPTDAVHAHAGEACDGRRERGPVRAELDQAAADALADSGLRARHPVLATPHVALRVENHVAVRVRAAAAEPT